MPGLRGADEIIVGQPEPGGEGHPVRGQLIAILLRHFVLGESSLLDFLAVLVEAGEEENFFAEQPVRARDDVGDDLLVGVAEVRLAVEVINGGRDVEQFVHVAATVGAGRGVGNCPVQWDGSRTITRQTCPLSKRAALPQIYPAQQHALKTTTSTPTLIRILRHG